MRRKVSDVLVVKVGTSTLMYQEVGGSERLERSAFDRIGRQLVNLQRSGLSVVLVSSAAITAGIAQTRMSARPSKLTRINELQRLASIGWRYVLNEWSDAMPGSTIGELLLTQHELRLDSERAELLNVTHTLLQHGDIPVANENDAVTNDEIAFGDNDALAATFAAQIKGSALFDCRVRLVVLTDVHGVYEDRDRPASIIRQISNVADYRHLGGSAGSTHGTGGMVTKFAAAEIATKNGVEMWIAHGRTDNAIQLALDGQIGTRFICTGAARTNVA